MWRLSAGSRAAKLSWSMGRINYRTAVKSICARPDSRAVPAAVRAAKAAGKKAAVTGEENMSPSRPFILRPVATSLLMVGILLAGFVAYNQLPVSALPQVDYPTIQVLTFYPGASPDVMASSVTAPLERQFGQVPGLKQMTSTSSFGSSVITLQFALELNIDVAEQEVQAAINAAGTFLPAQPARTRRSTARPTRPIAPILTLALTSEDPAACEGGGSGRHSLAQKISQLPGVGLVSISGGQKPAVRIQANPTALAAYGLSLEDVRTALGARPTSIRPRAISTVRAKSFHHRRQRSAADRAQITSRSSSLIAMARRCACPTSPTSSTAPKTCEQAAWMNNTPGRDSEHPAAARRQHHRRGRPHRRTAAAAEGFAARLHRSRKS